MTGPIFSGESRAMTRIRCALESIGFQADSILFVRGKGWYIEPGAGLDNVPVAENVEGVLEFIRECPGFFVGDPTEKFQ